jgi:hypothetical protein
MSIMKRFVASTLLGLTVIVAAQPASAQGDNCHWAPVMLSDGTVVNEYHCH